MSKELIANEKGAARRPKPVDKAPDKEHSVGPTMGPGAVLNLQRQVGNQAVQRLIAQRQSDEGFDLDESTTSRINQARGGGQALDGSVQKQMSSAMGHDFSGVRVHTSSEADSLNQQLSAKAFTTGQDIFFKQGTYDPGSSAGKELLAHELTHVVQQSTGQVSGSGSGMTVRPAGDAFEQEADSMASQAVQTKVDAGAVQRQEALEEEEPPAQMKADETVQRQEALEEEEPPAQMKADETVQRQEALEEEEPPVQMKADETVQRQEALEEEEPPAQMKADEAVQRQEALEEEEPPAQMKADKTVQPCSDCPDEAIG